MTRTNPRRSWPALHGTAVLCLLGGITPAAAIDASAASAARQTARLSVFVSILPQKYFVERVGGDRVNVSVLLPAGQSEITYEPTARQLVALSAANVYFRTLVPFEKRLADKIDNTLRSVPIVNTCRDIDLRPGDCSHHQEQDHANNEAHTADNGRHDEIDPHVWMSPRLVKPQARIICEQLCILDPAHEDEFRRNLAAFEADLDHADQHIAALLAPYRGRAFFVFHPAYGYFADAYGLEQVAVQSGGKEPAAKRLAELIDRAKRDGVRAVFVQPQFSRISAGAVARQIDGVTITVDPMTEDYLSNIVHIAECIHAALQGRTSCADAPSPLQFPSGSH